MEIDAAASRLIKLLAHMAQQSQAALAAASVGDELKTRHAVDALRLLQAKLGTVDQDVRDRMGSMPAQQQEQMRQHLSQIQGAKDFVRSWCKRYQGIVHSDELSRSTEGRHAILDYTLPLDWHFQGDVFILFDRAELAFVPELSARGQERILLVDRQSDVDLMGQTNVTQAPNALALRDYFMKLGNPAPVRLAFLNPQSQDQESQTWKDIKHAFTLSVSNYHTSAVLGNAWMTQGLANLQSVALSTNMAALKVQLKGYPIVIISPGPSLDKNIHLLKALKGRAILMAAAQCARALQAAEVVPDFVVVADPNNLVYFLDGVDTSKIDALIVGVSSHPDFYKLAFKNIITFNANAKIDAWISDIFGDTLPISAAGSVSIDCFFFAKYLECSHIIMVGLDLALSGGKAYSNYSANNEASVIVNEIDNTLTFSNVTANMERIFLAKGSSSEDAVETLLTLPGYYGGTVQTRPNYYLFHREFVELAKQEAGQTPLIPLINSTEGGAFIEGFRHISLETAIEEFLPKTVVNFSEKIENAARSMDKELRNDQYQKAKSHLVKSIENSLSLVTQCKALTIKAKLTPKQLARLNKTEKQLIHSLREIPFISLPNIEQIKKVMEIVGDTSTVSETNKVAVLIYDTIEITGKSILNILSDGKITTKSQGN